MISVRNGGSGASEILVGIRLSNPPTKTSYTAGESLALAGMTVQSIKTDGDTETYEDITGWTTDKADGSILYENTTSIVISWVFEGKTYITSQPVTVQRVLSSIVFTTQPTKTVYGKGEELDLTGATVTAIFTSGWTESVVPTYSPANGTVLSDLGSFVITATYTENGITKTATTVAVSLNIVTWASGTDSEIVDMVAAADAGIISLADYWAVGDERTVALSSMAATGVGESHAAQNVVLRLDNAGGLTLANGKTCSFIVGQKNCLNEYGYMNSTNTTTGSWNDSARRTWCNNIYKNAIPSALLPIFKEFVTVTGAGAAATSGTVTCNDYFALPAEYQILGTRTHSVQDEANVLTQWTIYQTASNRVKKVNGSHDYWWERSPCSGYSGIFCIVDDVGTASNKYASSAYGVAPFGCI